MINFFNQIEGKVQGKAKKELEDKLLQLFDDLHHSFSLPRSDKDKINYEIYNGDDSEFKRELEKFFGDAKNIYGSLESHAIVNQLHARYLQPFYATTELLNFVPNGEKITTVKRVEALINEQLKSEDYLTELDKLVKNALITGISYFSLGWKSEVKVLNKTVLKVEKSTDPTTGEVREFTTKQRESEEVTLESPDFLALRNSEVLHPKVSRWEDVPYVIVRQKMSKYHFNKLYGGQKEEFDGDVDAKTDYETALDDILNTIPGTSEQYGNDAINEVQMLHFYFADGNYIIAELEPLPNIAGGKQIYSGLNIVAFEKSPIQGINIPIFPLVLIPVNGRLEGESIVNKCKQLSRKLMEIDQHNLQALRSKALEPTFISRDLNLDINAYRNRQPNAIIPVEAPGGSIASHIFKGSQEPIDQAFLMNRESANRTMNQITGVNDFFVGNLGKSARLTGVQSLLSNALAQLAPGLTQINKFTKHIINALLLMNREYLPIEYVKKQVSLHEPEDVETYEIPYPLEAKLNTPVDGDGDNTVRVGMLFRLLELSLSLEASKPGTIDLNALLLYTFTQSGVPEIKRFLLKSPFTENEVESLKAMEEIMRRFNQSGFANNENAFGVPTDQTTAPTQNGSFSSSGQDVSMPSPSEVSGVGGQ